MNLCETSFHLSSQHHALCIFFFFFTGEVLLLLLCLVQSTCTVHLSARALHMLWPGATSEEQGYVTATRNIHLPLELPLLGASSWSAAAAG